MKRAQRLILTHRIFVLIGALLFCPNAAARNLIQIPIPIEDHDPLYVDMASIQRMGDTINFRYVLDVPIFGAAYSVKRYRSNEMEAAIDCNRQLFSVFGVTAYAGVAATGNFTGKAGGSESERAPVAIDMRKGSTTGYLSRYLCKQRHGSSVK